MTGKRIWKIMGAALAGFFLLMFLVGQQIWFFSAIWTLVSGWATYPGRVLPQVTLNPEMILCGLGALGLALYFGHRFMTWLAENLKFLPSPWAFRDTASLSFLVLSMFGTSIAMTGIVHQAAWLTRTGSMIEMRGMAEGALQMNNAREISLYLLSAGFDEEKGGVYPESLHNIYAEDGFEAHLCPYRQGGDEPWLYPAAGKTLSNSRSPVLVSPRPNQEGKIVVLSHGGSVDSYKVDELPPEVAAVFQ